MVKILCISGMAVAGLLALVFGLDLGIGIPFDKVSMVLDIGMLVAAVCLGYGSWSTYREQA